MAFFSSNIISFLFFTTLSLSLQIHARDSQFFSKVTHANTNNIGEEMEFVPNKQQPLNKPSEQEPMFIPETDHNSYGLYGHETGQFPPTTTTTYQPYKTQSSEDAYNTNLNDFNKDDTYGENQNELGNSKYRQVFNSLSNQKENNQKYYYSNNGANDRYYYYNNNNKAASSRNYGEREGMSDTRFMEGGKYFYNPNFYGDSTRGPKSKSWENNMGYFGRPNLHPQSYENSNAMEGYQNQEFEVKRDDFEP